MITQWLICIFHRRYERAYKENWRLYDEWADLEPTLSNSQAMRYTLRISFASQRAVFYWKLLHWLHAENFYP